jgi:hypothetical protein
MRGGEYAPYIPLRLEGGSRAILPNGGVDERTTLCFRPMPNMRGLGWGERKKDIASLTSDPPGEKRAYERIAADLCVDSSA